jgi:hypothetical protein
MRPMLPIRYRQDLVAFPCYVQPKLNGLRALYQLGTFQLDDEELTLDRHTLRHLSEPLSKIFNASTILDGVLYRHDWSRERLHQAIDEGSPEVEYHVFDVVNFHRSFESRFMAPASILIDTSHRHIVKTVETHRLLDNSNVDYFYEKWLTAGYAGMIYRLNDCPYTSGKTKHLLKREKRARRKPHGPREPDAAGAHTEDLSDSPPAQG